MGLRKELLGWLAHNSFQSFKDRVRAIIARRRPIRNRIDEMTKWIGDIVAGPNGVIFIQVKGAAASTVRWVANVRTVEVTF